jgi:Holliday junction resolvasome RuvABC DNA-binding subunit
MVGAEAALRALAKLGYSPAEADDAVRHVLAGNGKQETAALVKAALGYLAGR